MALDRAKLGTLASEQMEALEDAYGDDDGVDVGDVMTIVEVLMAEGDEVRSMVRTRFTTADPYRIIGILRVAEQNLLTTMGGD